MLLYNEYNGLFRYPELGKKFGLKNEVFEKISAIVIYSSPIQGVMFNDTVWALSNNQYRVLLNSSLNNKQKINLNYNKNETGYKILGITGLISCFFIMKF